MPLDLERKARSTRAALLAAIADLVGTHRDARELLLGEDGELKPAAARLLGRLAKRARLDRAGFEPEARLQDYRLGQQDIVRTLGQMLHLDVRRLEELQRKLEGER